MQVTNISKEVMILLTCISFMSLSSNSYIHRPNLGYLTTKPMVHTPVLCFGLSVTYVFGVSWHLFQILATFHSSMFLGLFEGFFGGGTVK